ncbi:MULTISPECIES: CotY/CotZ family spore coat protein [Bacillaceae]|uniref:CotY/CotZ family spore coat protein n=1 Tax=Bacillaceae TaxID=186817 RepID=UPI0007615BB7|nr:MULTISPECIES: CotY/CotZ family spore coat protein [Bacillaceae]
MSRTSFEHKHTVYKSKCAKKPDHHKKHCCDSHQKCCEKPFKDHHENCVEDVLRAILEAQKKAKKEDHCKTSCEHSIKDLRSGKRKVTKNTIPFILYCGCEPFKGTGVLTYSCCKNKKKKFKTVDSFIFKIKELKGKCAVLELLAFKCDLKYSAVTKPCDGHNVCSPSCQMDGKCVDDLIKTGICINVDLSSFQAVSCLPAVKL